MAPGWQMAKINMKFKRIKLPVMYDRLHWKQRIKVREQYISDQNGLCYYCKAPLSGDPSEESLSQTIRPEIYPPNFFKHPIHLHHCHITGLTIGAVHAHCNAVLYEYYGE